MKKKILFLSVIFCQILTFAQEDAWVYLTDKENVADALANPITILTQDALDRKALHSIAIDERDVPVNESYITELKNAPGITVMAKSKWFNAVHVRGSQSDINDLLNLTFVDHIEFADSNLGSSRGDHVPVDKFQVENTRVEFVYGNTLNQVEMINIQSLHELDFTGAGMVVAVMDAGFTNVDVMGGFQRLRDAGNLMDGYDFVDRTDDVYAYTGNDHGTKVLSTMAGFVQDEYVGTGPDAAYYLFRTEDVSSENPVEESYWVEAAERADSLGVDIINTSLGYKTYDNPNYSYAAEDLDGNTAFITRGANIAFEKGMLLVNSAGNAGASGVNAPADAAGVLSIGAVDADGNYASFSSQGSAIQPTQKPDVSARGAGSYVISSFNSIVQNNGTSFSSPITAGAIASFWQAFPEMTNTQIMGFVRQSASQYNTPDYFLGYGIPDFEQAMQLALELRDSQRIKFRIFPNPVDNILQITFPANVDQAQLVVFDVLGKRVLETVVFEQDNHVNLETLSNGIYLAKLQAANGTFNTFKLIKE